MMHKITPLYTYRHGYYYGRWKRRSYRAVIYRREEDDAREVSLGEEIAQNPF